MGLLSIGSELDVVKHATSTVNFTILIIFVWRDSVLLIKRLSVFKHILSRVLSLLVYVTMLITNLIMIRHNRMQRSR